YFTNNGNAIFTSAGQTFAGFSGAPDSPVSAAAADFSNDGKADIAVVAAAGESGASQGLIILLGNGSNQFPLNSSPANFSGLAGSGTANPDEPIITGDFGNHQT